MKFDEPYIRSIALIGFCDAIRDLGGDPVQILNDCKFDSKLLHSHNSLISYQSYVDLLETAARQLQDPNFGFKYAHRMKPQFPNYGPVLLLARASSSIGNWQKSAVRYLKNHSSALQLHSDISEEEQTLILKRCVHQSIEPNRQVNDIDAAFGKLVINYLLNEVSVEPTLVRFPHSTPNDLSYYDKVFGCPLEFNCKTLSVHFPSTISRHPITRKLRNWGPFIRKLANPQTLDDNDKDPKTSLEVEIVLSALLGTGRCNLEEVASLLGKHPKKLQRKLLEEKQTFSNILEDLRIKTAKHFLETSNVKISQISGLLDYSATPPFALAFRRCTGINPGAYRRQFQKYLQD